MKKLIVPIIVSIFIGALLFFAYDNDEQNLGDNYFYLPKYEAIDMGYPGGAIIYKSTQKYHFDQVKIPGNVTKTNANEDFIIAERNNDISYQGHIKSVALNKQILTSYYIIIKKTNCILGPFTQTEYLSKRKTLNIPNQLTLKEIQ